MVRYQMSGVDEERAAVHFLRKSSTFLSSVSPRIVSMNNEFSPVVLWLELSQGFKDIITIVLGVKDGPLRKCQDQGKSQWIPCNGTMIFRPWIVCLALSGGVSPGRS
jgi:hypothetical protein